MRKESLKNQLTVFFIALLLFCTAILDATFFLFYKSVYQRKIQDSYNYLIDKNYTDFEYKTDFYKNIMDNITRNSQIKDLLQDDQINIVDRSNQLQSVISTIINNDRVLDLTIYTENPGIEFLTPYVRYIGDESEESWYLENKQTHKSVFFCRKLNRDYISFVYPFRDETQALTSRIATLKLNLPIDSLIPSSEAYDIIIESNPGEIVYSTNPAVSEALHMKPSGIMQMQNGSDLLFFGKQYFSGQLTLYYAISKKNDNIAFRNTMLLTVFLTFLFFLLVYWCIMFYAKKVMRQINEISDKIKKVGQGDWTEKSVSSSYTELALIDSGLNDMIKQINSLVKEKYVSEIEQNTAMLKALQMQINPHFLYNTLEIMNKLALTKNPSEIGKISVICQNLGKLFRYNIASDKNIYVYLPEELASIQYYLEIQNIKYYNNLKVYTDIAPEAEQCIILKFILQPIIENSIKYGIGDDFSGCILIEASVHQNTLFIEIQDDGAGISEQKLSEITKFLNSPQSDSKHVGLRNVHQRIQLAYGRQYGLTIQSKPNIGTSVLIKLPVQNKKNGRKGTSEI